MIIRAPVQRATWRARSAGALRTDVGDQESVTGSYRPPVLVHIGRAGHGGGPGGLTDPPQTIISVPVQTALCSIRPGAALIVAMEDHVSLTGSYRLPVPRKHPVPFPHPPQMIISVPVQTAVCLVRPSGALIRDV